MSFSLYLRSKLTVWLTNIPISIVEKKLSAGIGTNKHVGKYIYKINYCFEKLGSDSDSRRYTSNRRLR